MAARQIIVWGVLIVGATIIVHGAVTTCGEASSKAYRVAAETILEHPAVTHLVGADVRIVSPSGFQRAGRSGGILGRRQELVSYAIDLLGSNGSAWVYITLLGAEGSWTGERLLLWKDGERHDVIVPAAETPSHEVPASGEDDGTS